MATAWYGTIAFREIADNLFLSLGTTYKHFKLFKLTGVETPHVSSREVNYFTFCKWRTELEKDCQTILW